MTRAFVPPPRELSPTEFMTRFGSVYEHSPWIARSVLEHGLGPEHDTVDGLAAALAAIVDRAGSEARLALLREHPDLGGRAAIRGELSDDSSAEQASAGLDRCSPEEYARLQRLNDEYRERFGFPFILAVRNRTRDEVLDALERRLGNEPRLEFEAAIEQVHEIARLRLDAIASAGPAR